MGETDISVRRPPLYTNVTICYIPLCNTFPCNSTAPAKIYFMCELLPVIPRSNARHRFFPCILNCIDDFVGERASLKEFCTWV